MNHAHSLRIAFLALLLIAVHGLWKKVKNKKKSLYKKTATTIASSGNNYMGVVYGSRVKDELNRDQAQAHCLSKYGTSLATILTKGDQAEIYDLLYSEDWGNAVNSVWIGFKNELYDSGSSWAPYTKCEDDWECSAEAAKHDTWHDITTLGVDDEGECGNVKRGNRRKIGKWESTNCITKKDFICNAAGGKYDPLPFIYGPPTPEPTPATFSPSTDPTTVPSREPTTTEPTAPPSYEVCDSSVNDGELDIAFLVDEGYKISTDKLAAVNMFMERIIANDINDMSLVSLIEFSGNNWRNYRQYLDFMTLADDGRQTVIDAIQSNVDVDVWDEGIELTEHDVMYEAIDLVLGTGNYPCSGCQSNLVVVLLDGEESVDLDCNTKDTNWEDFIDEYPSNVDLIIVIIGGGYEDKDEARDAYPCLYEFATQRSRLWGGRNFVYSSGYSLWQLAEIEYGYNGIRQYLCKDLPTASAYGYSHGLNEWMDTITGMQQVNNNYPVLFSVIIVLLVANMVCLCIYCMKRVDKNKYARYEVVDVESSELSS